MVDTGLTIANPAYGIYRLAGGRPAWNNETPVDPWTQVTLRDTNAPRRKW